MRKPLNGIRILEFGESASAAVCNLMLSDFGAEVIKLLHSPQISAERSSYAAQNRGKKSVVLDLSVPDNIPVFQSLVKSSDAIVTDSANLAPESGMTYHTLKELNPRIVYTSISGYGTSGPYAHRPASDQAIQAESGMMSITGEEDSDPVVCGAPISDYLGSYAGCIGTLMAVIGAQKTGCGRFIDVSAMDTMIFCIENLFSIHLKTGFVPAPFGNNYHLTAPVGVFPCKDGALNISVTTDTQWQAFAEALGHEEWLNDPRFSTLQDRVQNYLEINKVVESAFAEYTLKELITRLQSRRCVYGQVNDLHDVFIHPQVPHRQTFVSAAYPDGDSYAVPSPPIRMQDVKHELHYQVPDPITDINEILNIISNK